MIDLDISRTIYMDSKKRRSTSSIEELIDYL